MRSSKVFFTKLTLIHAAMLLGQVLLLVIAVWEIVPHRDKEHDIYYQIAEAVVFILGFLIAYKLFNKYTKSGKARRGIREKLRFYEKALYSLWAISEIVSITAVIAFIMTGEKGFIYATVFSMIVFLMNRPSVKKTISDLDLDDSEIRILKTPDAAL